MLPAAPLCHKSQPQTLNDNLAKVCSACSVVHFGRKHFCCLGFLAMVSFARDIDGTDQLFFVVGA